MNRHDTNKSGSPTPGKGPMSRLPRWVFHVPLYLLFLTVALVGIGVLVLQTPFVQNRIRSFIAETASSRLNGTVTIGHMEGNVLSTITLEKIRLASADSAPVLSIDSLSIRYLLPRMFFSILHVEDLSIDGLRLDLEKSPNGDWNLPLLSNTSGETKSAGNFPFRVIVGNLDLTDAEITVRQGLELASYKVNRFSGGLEYGRSILLSIMDASFALGPPDALQVSLSGDLAFDPLTRALTADQLSLESGKTRILLEGDCRFSESEPFFSLLLTASPIDLAELSESFSIRGLPDAAAFGTLQVSGTPTEFQHDVSLKLDGVTLVSDGSGGYDVNRGLWTSLSADIRALDISRGWLPVGDILSGTVSADIQVNATGFQSVESLDVNASAMLQGMAVSGILLDSVDLSASWSHESLVVEQLSASCGKNHLDVSGYYTPNTREGNMAVTLDLDRAQELTDPLSKRYPWISDTVTLGGKTTVDISAVGTIEHPLARFTIVSNEVSLLSYQADHMDLKGLWTGLPGPDNRIEDIDLTLQGVVSDGLRAGSLSLKGSWRGWLENPDSVFSISALDISNDRFQVNGLNLSGNFHGRPAADDTTMDLVLLSDQVRFDGIDVQTLKLSSNLRGPLTSPSGQAVVEAIDASVFGERFTQFSLAGNIFPDNASFDLSGHLENGSTTRIEGNISNRSGDRKLLSLSKLSVTTAAPWPELTLSNTNPLRFILQGDVLTVDDCSLSVNDALLSLHGDLSGNEARGLNLDIDNLEIDKIPSGWIGGWIGGWIDRAGLAGILSANLTLDGPWKRPVISSDIRVSQLTGYAISQESEFSATFETADDMASVHAALFTRGTSILSADGSIPLLISLSPFSIKAGSDDMKAAISTQDLRFSVLPIPGINGVDWDASADMDLSLSGNILSPDMSGTIGIHDGYLTLTRNRLTYETIEGSFLLSTGRMNIDKLLIEGEREGRLLVTGEIFFREGFDVDMDLTLRGSKFYIPFQKAISTYISPELHLTGGWDTPLLSGEVTIKESRINLDRLSLRQRSDIQIVEGSTPGSDPSLLFETQSDGSVFLSPLTADILVKAPRNVFLKGRNLDAEISGEIAISKKPDEPFVLIGPLNALRGNYYFMGKNFELTEGNLEFLGLKEINPNVNIVTQSRFKSATIIVSLHGTAQELTVDLSSDPSMDESDIISYIIFGRPTENLSGTQAFSVESAAMGYVGGLLADELRELLGGVEFIDTFSFDPSSSESGIGSVTLGKYVTPELFISHRQSLSQNETSVQDITYELTPSINLEAQIGRDYSSSVDLTWEFDF